MKTKLSLLLIFSVLLAGNTWAQLNCTNCFQPDGVTPLTNPIIATSPGTYTGDIKLSTTATAVFTITGNGRFTINGSISGGNAAAGAISLEIRGGPSGAFFMTGAANTYLGGTKLTSGFLMLGKGAGIVSIPGKLTMCGATGVYCMADNQLGGMASIVDFTGVGTTSPGWRRFNLNGTTQRVAAVVGVGPSSGSNTGIIQNYEFNTGGGMYPYSAGVIGGTGIPTLEIIGDGTNTTYTYGPDCLLRGMSSGATGVTPATKLVVTKSGLGIQVIDSFNQFGVTIPIEFNCTDGILRCQNPNSNAPKISFFNSTGTGTIDFYASVQSSTYTIPTAINFKGDGTFTKSGPGIIKTTNTIYTTTGIFRVFEGTFQSVGGTFTGNTATLTVDSPTTTPANFNPTFDLWGYNAAFGGLTGGGTIRNDNGNGAVTSTTGYYDLTIGQGATATFTFDGVIKNNSTNLPVARAANAGGINLYKAGTGTQLLNGVNTYSGPTTVSAGKLGGSGSIVFSAVTVGPGAVLFGGTGTGNNGVLTTGNLTFTGTSATPSRVAVYVANSATPATNALSLIQVGGTAGSRTGSGTITAGSGVVVALDFMESITVADGVYTVISSADASALAGTFNLGINNSFRCLGILKNSQGIQVVVGGPLIAASTAAGTPDLQMLCAGNTYTNAIAISNGFATGTWKVFKTDGTTDDDTGTAVGNTTVAASTITTGSANLNPTAPTSVMVQYTRLGCPSNLLLLKINVVPVLAASTAAGTPDLAMLCSGSTYTNAIAITNGATNGTWKVFKADGTTDDDTGTGISGATAAGGTITTGSANLSPTAPTSVKVQYTRLGCLSNQLLLKINTIVPSLAASTTAGTPDLTMLCAGSSYTDAIAITNGVSTGTWKVFKADGATSDDTGTTISGTATAGSITTGSANLSPTTPTSVNVQYSRLGCLSNLLLLKINTIVPSLAASTAAGTPDLTMLCAGSSYTDAIAITNGVSNGTWKVFKADGATSDDTGTTISGTATAGSITTGSANLSPTAPTSVKVQYTRLGCLSNLLLLKINVLPTLVASSQAPGTPLVLCDSGPSGSITIGNGSAVGAAGSSWKTYDGAVVETTSVFSFSHSSQTTATVTPNVNSGMSNRLVEYTNAAGCVSNKLSVDLNAKPVLGLLQGGSATGRTTFCSTELPAVSLSATGGSGKYSDAGNVQGWLSGNTGVATLTASSSPNFTGAVLTYVASGSTTITVRDSRNCLSDGKVVTINTSPTLAASPAAGNPDLETLCSGTTYTNAIAITNGSTNGTWKVFKADGTTDDDTGTTVSGATGTAGTIATGGANLSPTAPTSVKAGYTSQGCSSNLLPLKINVIPSIAVSPAAGSPNLEMLCSGSTYTNAIAVTNGVTNGTWKVFKADGTTDDNTGTTVSGTTATGTITTGSANLSPAAPVSVQVRYTSQGCSSNLLLLKISLVPSLAASTAAGSPDLALLCPASSYANAIAITNGSTNGTWKVFKADGTTDDDTGTSVSGTATAGSITTGSANLSPTASTSVKVRYTNQGCSSNLLLLTINVPPSLAASAAAGSPDLALLCPGMTYANAIAITNGSTNGTWKVFKADGTTDDDTGTSVSGTATAGSITTGSANLSPNAPTSVKVRYTNQGCSSNLLLLTINVPPSLAASAAAGSPDLALLCPASSYPNAIAITNGSTNGTWKVFKADGTTDDDTGTAVSGTATAGTITTGSANLSPAASTSVKVRYTSQGCSSNLLLLTINVPPSLAASAAAGSPDLALLCPGMTYANAIAITNGSTNGTWKVFKADGTTDDDTGTLVSGTSTAGTITTGSANLSPAASTSVKVRYTIQGCSSNLLLLTINVPPSLAASAAAGSQDLALLCPASSYPNAIAITNGSTSGTWKVFKADGTTDDDTGTSVSGTATAGSITTGNANLSPTAPTSVKVRYTNQGCPSNLLLLKINGAPSIAASTAAGSPDLALLCPGMTYANAIAITNGSTNGTWKVFKADGTTDDDTGTSVSGTATAGSITTGSANLSPTASTSVKVRYTNQGCSSNLLLLTIKAPPSLAASTAAGSPDLEMLCAGSTYTHAIALTNGSTNGTWKVFKADGTTDDNTGTTVSGTATEGSLTIGNANLTSTAATSVQVQYTSQGCLSNFLLLKINVLPSFTVINDLTLCPGQEQAAISPARITGTDRAEPTGYKWQGGATGGLPDNTASFRTLLGDWTQAEGLFTASGTLGTYPVTVTATNATTTCISTQVFNLVIGSGLTIAAGFASPICSGTNTNITMSSPAANVTYTWSVSTNTVGATGQGAPQSSPRIEQPLTNTGTSDVTVTYTISGRSGNCTAQTTAQVAVSKDIQNTVITTTGGGHACIDPVSGSYTTSLQPTAQGATSWTYYSELSAGNPAGISMTGYSQQANKSSSSAITVADHLTLSGGVYGVVDYYFRMYNGICLGPESPKVSVTLHTAPTLTIGQPALRVCSGQTTSLELGSTTGPYLGAPVKYTWYVTATTTTPTVSGYTTVAEGGESVGGNPAATPPIAPATQPSQAVSGGSLPQTLSIPGSATTQGEIAYHIKPWLAGCPGSEGTIAVAVQPLPVANVPTGSPFVYCSGTSGIAMAFTATGGGDRYSWTGGSATGFNDQVDFGGQPTAFTASATGAEALVATVNVRAKNSLTLCESAAPATFTITVNPAPSITTINDSASNPATLPAICVGPEEINAGSANIAIASSAAGTQYTWSASRTDGTGEVSIKVGDRYQPIGASTAGPGTAGDSPLQPEFIATANATGSVTLRITPRKGQCVGTAREVTIGIRGTGDSFTTIVTNAQPVICSGAKTDITVGAAGDPAIYRYSWTYTDPGGNVSGGNAGTGDVAGGSKIEQALFSTATPKKAGHVTYYVTVDNGACSGGTIPVNVEVDPVPTITPVASTAICSGTAAGIVLSTDVEAAESAAKVTYTWTIDNPAAVENTVAGTVARAAFTDQTLVNRSPTTIDAPVTYHFTAKYAACAGPTADVVRTVTAPIAGNTIGTTAGKACLGDQVTLTANAVSGAAGGEATYQWWAGGAKIEGATARTYTVPTTTSSKADYQVRVTNRCQPETVSGLSTVEVTSDAYFEGASAAALATTAVVNKDWVKFAYTPATGSEAVQTVFVWNFGDATPTSNIQYPSHLYTTQGPSYTPTLQVSKSGQPDCKKRFTLTPIVVTGTPVTDTYTGEESGAAAVSVFPIPARDQVTVSSSGQLQRIVVSDLRGRPVMSLEAAGGKAGVSISALSPGVYLLTVESSAGTRCLKIIKE